MAGNQTVSVGVASADVSVVNNYSVGAWMYVTNEDGAGRITFTIDGATAATNGGDDMFYVAPVAGAYTRVRIPTGTVTVKIIGSAATEANIQVVSLDRDS